MAFLLLFWPEKSKKNTVDDCRQAILLLFFAQKSKRQKTVLHRVLTSGANRIKPPHTKPPQLPLSLPTPNVYKN